MEYKQKILIVDDKLENIFSLKQILSDVNIEIIDAVSGNDALVACINHDFAVAILDVQMPEMDGYELAALLRSDEKTKHLPIIFVSAVYSSNFHVFKGYDSGAVDFLVKPFDAKILISKLNIFLELDRQKSLLKTSNTQIESQLKQLKASENRFSSLVNTIPDIVYRIDQDGNFIYINEAIEKLGYEAKEVIGRHFSTIIWPVDLKNISRDNMIKQRVNSSHNLSKPEKLFDERRTGKRKTNGLEIRLIPKKGSLNMTGILDNISDETIVVEVNSAGFYSNDIKNENKIFLGTVGVIRDITERKKLENKLRKANDQLETKVRQRTAELVKQNERLLQEIEKRKNAEKRSKDAEKEWKDIFEAIGHMTVILDKNHKIVKANRATFEQFGLPKEALIGKKCYEIFHQSSSPHTKCPMGQCIDAGEIRTTEINFEHMKKAFIISCTPVFDENLEFQKIIHIATDITERKKLEKQLIQAQKMEAIGVLAGGVAHDFNNIISIIIGYADLALDAGISGSLQEEIEEIKIAGERGASLTRQLLAFSRKQIIQPKILNLNKLLEGIEKMLERLIGEDVEILKIPEPALWRVKIDSGQMEQVIMNLAINARDAMHRGGKLTIETSNEDIDENYFYQHSIEGEPGHYVMLAVSDTGTGMDKETQKHIFEPFYTTKKKGRGTGLGLSTIYGIIKQNNGFVWVYSEPGQGSTFKVYLPKTEEGVVIEKKEKMPVIELGGSETILIVEDDDNLRNLVRKILKKNGYKVLVAENGEDALRVSKEHDGQIDLLLTDVIMPKMDGEKTAKLLEPLHPQMKTIFMSGYTDNAIVHHRILPEEVNFLQKPFPSKVLMCIVREVLDKE